MNWVGDRELGEVATLQPRAGSPKSPFRAQLTRLAQDPLGKDLHFPDPGPRGGLLPIRPARRRPGALSTAGAPVPPALRPAPPSRLPRVPLASPVVEAPTPPAAPPPRLPPEVGQLWEANAGWWAEEFTEGADPEYSEQILPILSRHLDGASRVLDVGCGEGQVSRLAARIGGVELVVGVDPTWPLLQVAAERGGVSGLAQGVAAALPVRDGSVDAVVACLVFEHVEAVDEAIAEVGRVLAPGGRFVFLLNHPLLQVPESGWIDDTILGEQYWRIGPYLREDSRVEEVAKDVWIPFIHRPLSRYVGAIVSAGMVVTGMEEPAPPPGFLALAAEYTEAATIPRLLVLRAERRGD